MLVKLCHQQVNLLIGPIVDQVGFRQLWEGYFHGSGLFDGALFYALAVIRLKAVESFSKGVDIQEGNGKEADATAGASKFAGHFSQQGGGCPLEPVIGFLVQRRRAWRSLSCHGHSFHFDGEIDDEIALGRVEALVVDLDDPVALFLVKLQDPSVEVIALVGHVV